MCCVVSRCNASANILAEDGGPVEDLGPAGWGCDNHGFKHVQVFALRGLVQLLRRRRRWVLSFDVGDDPACEPYSHAAIGCSFSCGVP